MTVRVEAFEPSGELLERVEAFLRERELENNLQLAICEGLVRGQEAGQRLLLLLSSGERCVGVALMRPGQPLVLTDLPEAAVLALVEFLEANAISVSEFHAPEACAEHLASLLEQRFPATYERRRSLIIYAISTLAELLDPPDPGRAREAEARDEPVLARWVSAFGVETSFAIEAPADFARARIASRRASVYEASGELVSMACIGGHARGLCRVGPVYTPPEQRGRGYASALVAWVTRGILERGEQACLFAETDNPVSNRMYLRLGYREIGRVCTHERQSA